MKNIEELKNIKRPNLLKKGLGFLFLILAAFSFIAIASAQSTPSLIGLWKFDEATSGTCSGAVILDSSGNDNTGTCNNNPTWTTGKIGGALEFNGTNQSVSISSDVMGAGPLTISFWLKPGATGVENILNNGLSELGFISSDAANAYIYYANNIQVESFQFPFNAWTYVTVTRNSNGIVNIYLNGNYGSVTNLNSGANRANTNTHTSTIGSGTFNGILDDLRIYNYAISPSQVSNLYAFESGADSTLNLGPAGAAPAISNGSPSGSIPVNSIQATLSVTTNEPATCRYSTSNTTFANMTNAFNFENVDQSSTQHSANVTGLQNGQNIYYVSCLDTSYNETDGYQISFSVPSSSSSSGTQTIGSEALVSLPNTALWSSVVSFRPGNGDTVTLNPPRFSWTFLPNPTGSSDVPNLNQGNEAADVHAFIFQVAASTADLKNQTNLLVNVQTISNSYNFLAPFSVPNRYGNSTFYWQVGYIDLGNTLPAISTMPPTAQTLASVQQWSTVKSFTIAPNSSIWDRSMLADGLSGISTTWTGYLGTGTYTNPNTQTVYPGKGLHPHLLFTNSSRTALDQYLETYGGSAWQGDKANANASIATLWWPLANPASTSLTSLTSVTIYTGGSGYKVGDVLSFNNLDGGNGATVTVTAVNSAGTIDAIMENTAGSGYLPNAAAYEVTPSGGSGTNAKFNIYTYAQNAGQVWAQALGNVIFVWQMTQDQKYLNAPNIALGGQNYKMGDVLNINQNGNTSATVTVSAINPSNGAIMAFTENSAGSGYTTASNLNLTYPSGITGSGSGATVNITMLNQALENLANYYTSSTIHDQVNDIVSGCGDDCEDITNTLAYGFDWLYNQMDPGATCNSSMSDFSITDPNYSSEISGFQSACPQHAAVLNALKLRALFIVKGYAMFYAGYRPPSGGNCPYVWQAGDPSGEYACGVMNIGGGFTSGTAVSHPAINFYSSVPVALSAFNDDKDIREFFDLGLNYMIGVVFPYGHDGSVNQGRSYGDQDIFNGQGSVLFNNIIAQQTFPDVQFNLNPYWKGSAQWWDAMGPVNLSQGNEPWGDDGWGPDIDWCQTTFGQYLGYFLNDPVAYQHWINDKASVNGTAGINGSNGAPCGDTPFYYQFPMLYNFSQPAEQNSTQLSQVFPESGWAMGCSLPYNTSDCFNNGVGYVFQARPSGSADSHDYWSDLSYQIWAYGTSITDAGAQYDQSFEFSHMQAAHYSLFVNGLSPVQPVWDYSNDDGPRQPYYSYIFACEGSAQGCSTSTGDYDYVAADATNAYPTTNWQVPVINTPTVPATTNAFTNFATNESGAPLAGLQKVRRHMLFVHHKYFVIYDDFANASPAAFSSVYHVLENTLVPNSPNLTASGGFSYTSNIQKYLNSSVTGASISAPGSGYNIGDILYINDNLSGKGLGAMVKVASLTSSNGVATVSLVNVDSGGGGYTTTSGLGTTDTGNGSDCSTTCGTGATVNLTLNSSVTSALIVAGGSGYAVGDLLNIQQSGGSNAEVEVTAITGSSSVGPIQTVSIISGGSGYTTTSSGLLTSDATGSGSGATFSIRAGANAVISPTVPVYVQYINNPNELNIVHLTGNQVAENPILCENPATCENYYTPGQALYRAHAVWVSNATPQTAFHLITVVYPENPADVTAGHPAPVITGLDDYTAKVVSPDGTTDIISFNPSTASANGATMVVNIADLIPNTPCDSILTSTCGSGSTPTTGLFGDVIDTGRVTIYDAELTAQYAIGLPVPGFIRAQAQVDGNSTVDIYDAYLIAEYSIGLITKFPVQQ